MKQGYHFLQSINLFNLLDRPEKDRIAPFFHIKPVAEGLLLFRQGDIGEELFIVREGIVKGYVGLPNGKTRHVADFEMGDFFGEMAIIENDVRSATCEIQQDGELLTLSKENFFNLVNREPDIAIKVMYQMLKNTSQRLTSISAFLSDMIRWGNDARKRAITDEFTGCYNRRFMDESMADFLEGAKNTDKQLTMAMVDFDFFRVINDNYSHEVGDQVIFEVAKVFLANVRKIDLVVRFGGDEFAIIFPYTTKEAAREICETCRKEVQKLDILADKTGPVNQVTTSMGLAAYPVDGPDIETLRVKADEALYQAKEAGRNKVVVLGDKI